MRKEMIDFNPYRMTSRNCKMTIRAHAARNFEMPWKQDVEIFPEKFYQREATKRH